MNNSDIHHIIKCYKKVKQRGLKEKNDCLTYEDKIKWLCVFGCTELKIKCADKIQVKKYITEKLKKNISVPTLNIYNNAKEINENELPDQFVLKCNHGCGYNILIDNKKESDFNYLILFFSN